MSSFVKQKARYQQYNQGSTDCRDSRGRSIEVAVKRGSSLFLGAL